jgi:hypothetical protein
MRRSGRHFAQPKSFLTKFLEDIEQISIGGTYRQQEIFFAKTML